MTYPHAAVAKELNDHFVACKLESSKAGDLARKLNVRWLPGLVVADAEERPAHVQVGFLPPDDFLQELTFGRAVAAMGAKRYDDAHALFQSLAENEGAERAPDACYWWGISRYRQSKDFADCQEKWRLLAKKWPASQASRKVGYALEAASAEKKA